MANRKYKLTAANIKYLLAMKELADGGKGIRCVDVAENLGITKPSVHAMMNTFISLGLIKKDRYGTAFFSDEGWRLVETYSRYYELIWERLRPLNFSGDEARSAACAVLAEISTEGLELMADIAGNRVYQREGVNVVS